MVEKSTLPVRTAAVIQEILASAEGTAIPDLEAPDRVLIGDDDPAAIAALASGLIQSM